VTVISHEPYTDTFRLHLGQGRQVVMERSEFEQHVRLCVDALKPWCFEDRGELVDEYA
jgi:hypothetical protein